MQTTIRLNSDEYRLTQDGRVEVWRETPTGYKPDYEAKNFHEEEQKCWSWAWQQTRYELGSRAVLVSVSDVSPNALHAGSRPEFSLSFDLAGIPGNLNPSVKKTRGWRGTTSNRSVDAHGIVTIRKVRKLKNGDIAVTVS